MNKPHTNVLKTSRLVGMVFGHTPSDETTSAKTNSIKPADGAMSIIKDGVWPENHKAVKSGQEDASEYMSSLLAHIEKDFEEIVGAKKPECKHYSRA
jgi:hypothetical protein